MAMIEALGIEMIGKWKNLPEGIQKEVFIRLPVKSILQYRCLSKTWNKYFRNPDFLKLHANPIQMDSFSLILTKKVPASSENPHPVSFPSLGYKISGDNDVKFEMSFEYQISFPHWKNYITIVGSCNGLLCVQSDPDTLYVWNPITGEHEKLPQVPDEYLGPVFCVRTFGFGFDFKAGDYKVVKVHSHGKGKGSKVWVYTLGTESWRQLKDIPYEFRLSRGLQAGLFVNGSIHWLVHSQRVHKPIRLIVAFDVGAEKFREMKLPIPLCVAPESENYYYRTSISLFDANLCLSWDVGEGSVDVWVMKNYGVLESWTKLFRVNKLREDVDFLRLITSFKNGHVLLFSQPLNRQTHHNGDLILYSPVGENARFLDTSGYQKLEDAWVFAGSLVSVGSTIPQEAEN